ncbi:MAG TPA: excinuclease ABC subunit UvrC [Candidatus Saccharibacteria bacterium]|nr:excinuclease ABC subunit UvrC [Candidatus Saccharibacteria bacterium]
MNEALREKLKELPNKPGVYFHKNVDGEIIYVGKAAVLKNRVRQYFQKSRDRDPKTQLLVSEIVDTDWQVVDSEIEALFLEAELIRRYMPRYNILLRDDKSQSYVRIDFSNNYPSVTTTRRPLDDGAEYYGPFLSTVALRRALKYLRRAFPYSTHTTLPGRACLLVHLGLCPGPETGQLDSKAYKHSLRQLVRVLRGQKQTIVNELERDMKQQAKSGQYEHAAKLRDQIRDLRELDKRIIFGDKEFMDLSKDHALVELIELLGLEKTPKRIEGYDISHMSGTDTVASMVVFTNGVADKAQYRKFKSRIPGNDDFEHMRETMRRRFSQKNITAWGMPHLLLIDGGKGQLGAAIEVLQERKIEIPVIGLAKKYEEIVVRRDWPFTKLQPAAVLKQRGYTKESADFTLIDLPNNSNIVKLLQRIRDESHRFAVSYHSTLKVKRQTISLLDGIPGVGPTTKKKLLRHFGSLRAVSAASSVELEALVGTVRAKAIRTYLDSAKQGT